MTYIRVRDLNDEMWTVPDGSLLHRILEQEVADGEQIPRVPDDFIRDPNDRTLWALDRMAVLRAGAEAFEREPTQRIASYLVRQADFARLQQRVLARGLPE